MRGRPRLVLLFDAFVYALTCLVLSTRGDEASPWGRAVTFAIDVALITAWIEVTGGGRSEFWTLYLIVIAAVALRFGIVETIGVAVGLSVLLLAQLVEHGVLWTSRLYRPTLLLVAGFAIGMLSLQRADQRQKRFEMEAIAESRARELGRERAEVERLRKVDLARTEFVGVAAHELRTPLAAILGVLSTLKEHGAVLEDRVRVDLIDGAEAQAERLTRLVEDLLTVSRIQDGVLRLSMEPVDLRRPDRRRGAGIGRGRASAARARRARPGGVRRRRDRPRAHEPVRQREEVLARGDADRGPGRRRRSACHDRRRNAGSGIAPEDREAIFERFRRADRFGGAGCGTRPVHLARAGAGARRRARGRRRAGGWGRGSPSGSPCSIRASARSASAPSGDDAIAPDVSHITVPSLGRR